MSVTVSTASHRLRREAALLEAVRVRPNSKALGQLRGFYEAMAAGGGRSDRLQAGALSLLIEMHDKIRSRFFPGVADAMADQWGGWAEQQVAAA